MNYVEEEFHRLSMEDLRELLEAEWEQPFNGLIIGRDVDCVGRLWAFFRGESAYVSYEDFDSIYFRNTFDLAACDRPDWEKMVRLTPDNAQDWSFRKCEIIPKARAWEIVDRYLNTGSLE